MIETETPTAVSSMRLLGAFARYQWLMAWIQKNGSTDVLNSDFVNDYIEATHAKHKPTCWGAYKCPMLGRDLAHMAKCSALKRGRLGLGTNWQPGFPRWVWVYSVGHAAYLYAPNVRVSCYVCQAPNAKHEIREMSPRAGHHLCDRCNQREDDANAAMRWLCS